MSDIKKGIQNIIKDQADDNDFNDIEKKLDGLLGILQSQKAKSESEGKSWGWLMAGIAAVIAFIALAFTAYSAWKKGREVANLKHQLDLQEEAKKKAEIEVKITAESHIQQAQQAVINSMNTQISQTLEKIILAEKERQAITEKINKVTSWADIDKLIQ